MKIELETDRASLEFRGDKLRLVREARDLSQSRLSEIARIPQGSISKFESDIFRPDSEQVSLLADALEVLPSFFARADVLLGVGPGEIFHRKKQLGNRRLQVIHARMNMITLYLTDLFGSVEQPDIDLPQWDREDLGDIEGAAQGLRVRWYVPSGPIQSVCDLVARAGIFLVPFDFAGEPIDGIGRWIPGLPPIIFYNPLMPDDRLRFTIMHEIGHFCFHHGQSLLPLTKEVEREADQFSSAFLLPADEVRGSLRGLSLPKLGSLKLKWKSSMASLLMRAKQLETISSRTYDDLWRQMSMAGYRKIEPHQYDVHCENPRRRFSELIALHFERLDYSIAELGQMSGIKEPEARAFYGSPTPTSRPKLSLVSRARRMPH